LPDGPRSHRSLERLGAFIREQRGSARLSLRRLSELAGISNPYLSQIERGLRRPSAEILQQIAKALRISAETLYVQAGILEAPSGSPDLTRQILADRHISEEQKQALVQIYLSFRREHEVLHGPAPEAEKGRSRRARRRRHSSHQWCSGRGQRGPGRRTGYLAQLGWPSHATPRRALLHTSPLAQPGTGDGGGMNVYVRELASRWPGRARSATSSPGPRARIWPRWSSSSPASSSTT